MAFGTLLIGADTYNGAGPGEYVKSTVLFGQPTNAIKLAPGKRANAKAPTTFSVTRVLEKDVTVSDEVIRRRMTVNVQMNVPDGFTMAEVDLAIGDIATLASDSFLTRLALGES
jgi:hypothetical protein